MVPAPSAALHIRGNLRISLLRAGKVAGVEILAQRLEILLQLRHL